MAKRRGKRSGPAHGANGSPGGASGGRTGAVGYVRVSTDDQTDFGVSIAQQRDALAMFCSLYKLDLVAVETDAGLSGKSLDRPGLKAALARLEAGEARSLVVVKLDRLTRSVRDLGTLLHDYFAEASRDCQLFSVEEKVDTATPAGRLLLNILVTVAQWERENIVARVRGAMKHCKAVGRRTGGVPYGFELDPDGHRNKAGRPVNLRPCPAEVAGLVVLAALRESGGSFRGIAARLDGLGYVPRDGGKWSYRSVDKILSRPEFAETDEPAIASYIYRQTEGKPGLDFDALLALYRTFAGKGAQLAGQTEDS